MADATSGLVKIVTDQPTSLSLTHHHALPVFTRLQIEKPATHEELSVGQFIPYAETSSAIELSALSQGSKQLLKGLLRLGRLMQFPGGYGIDYAPLLKRGVWPKYISAHIHEVGAILKDKQAHILVAPGISGHPIAAQYAEAAQIPSLLLTKEPPPEDGQYPEGSFKIPSYTGGKDVVIHPDLTTVIEMLSDIVHEQLESQKESDEPQITLNIAVGDDIIDQGVMSLALGKSSERLGIAALSHIIHHQMRQEKDRRRFRIQVRVVAFVTPIKKAYNHPGELLQHEFGIRPFAGIKINKLYPREQVIDVEGVGMVQFR